MASFRPTVSVRGRTVTAVPKSRGRRKPTKSSTKRSLVASAPVNSGRRYAAGRVGSSADKIGGLLLGPNIEPDLMVELVLPMLFLENAIGLPTTLCVSSCATLHFAYAELGITAHPRAVDLIVKKEGSGDPTIYGRPDPHWHGSTFHGHCVLWLPGTRRFIDPTVEQYPEVRRFKIGPICGKLAASLATPAQQARLQQGELPPGTQVAVQRKDLLLLYTAVSEEFDDVVMSAPVITDNLPEIQRSGRNLAAQAIAMLSHSEVLPRARRAPYPKLQALLAVLADAQLDYGDPDNLRFVLAGDSTSTPKRLDELDLPTPRRARTVREIPAPRVVTPTPTRSEGSPPDLATPNQVSSSGWLSRLWRRT
jgi:hypothetical protein